MEPEQPPQHPSGILGSPVSLAQLPWICYNLATSNGTRTASTAPFMYPRTPSSPGQATTLLPPVKPQLQQPSCLHSRKPSIHWYCSIVTSAFSRSSITSVAVAVLAPQPFYCPHAYMIFAIEMLLYRARLLQHLQDVFKKFLTL